MKLELKHLAPYLPYGLKTLNGWNNIEEIIGLKDETYFIKGGNVYAYGDIQDCNPILRPLSDLSKLGDELILINEHTINSLIEEKFNEEYGMFSHYKGILDLTKDGDSNQRYDSNKTINFEIFEFVRSELLRGHFDIFGLIEKGLAIDVNEIHNALKAF